MSALYTIRPIRAKFASLPLELVDIDVQMDCLATSIDKEQSVKQVCYLNKPPTDYDEATERFLGFDKVFCHTEICCVGL